MIDHEVRAWTARFDACAWDDAEIARRLFVPPAAVVGLRGLSPDEGAARLDNALRQVHVPTPQEISAIRGILGVARAYANDFHPSPRAHLTNLYELANKQWGEPPTHMITSLAGVGKSHLVSAVLRLLGPAPSVDLPDHGAVQVIGGISVRIGAQTKQVDLLNAIAKALGEGEPFTNANAESQRRTRSLLFRSGCCFVIADEFQFLTLSTTANAQLAKTLGFLRQLGVPLFYVGNFSLGHRLLKRPQEERQRLLNDPIILLPDLPDEPAYIELLKACTLVFDGSLAIDPVRDAPDIHWLTGGQKRCLRMLLCGAFKIARSRSERDRGVLNVTLDDLRNAYDSSAYAANRRDIEQCRVLLAGGKIRQTDLVCPFELSAEQNETQKKLFDRARRADLYNAVISENLTQEEALGVKRMQEEFGFSTPVAKARTRPAASKRPKKTLEGLLRRV